MDVVRAALEAGAGLVQFRDKQVSAERAWALGRDVAEVCRDHECARWLANGRADLGMDFGAAGVHSPEGGMPVEAVRRLMGDDALVGASAHNLDEALLAEHAGADFVTLSPIFVSDSKPGYGPTLGVEGLRDVTSVVDIPVYGLAGIEPERVEACLEAGAYGVAVMGGIMAADAPGEKTASYLTALGAVNGKS